MYDLAASPSSVPSRICARSMSPLLTCRSPKSLTIQLLRSNRVVTCLAGYDYHLMVPLPDPGAPMMRVLALFPLEKFLEKVTATTDLVAVLASRLDSRLLVNMISGNIGL